MAPASFAATLRIMEFDSGNSGSATQVGQDSKVQFFRVENIGGFSQIMITSEKQQCVISERQPAEVNSIFLALSDNTTLITCYAKSVGLRQSSHGFVPHTSDYSLEKRASGVDTIR